MIGKQILLHTLFVTGALGFYSSGRDPSSHNARSETDRVAWGPCEQETPGIQAQCGNLTVPLDYTNPNSSATIDLQLLKVPAIRTPKKGGILLNFGGPGLESRYTLAARSQEFLAISGGEYDLIAHDPRGTANTITAKCFNSRSERELAYYRDQESYAEPEDTALLGKLWGVSKVLGNACHNYPGFRERGSLISTTFAARDLMQIVNATQTDGLLRFWGLSYGTILGATAAAMFPDKVDGMILDGVLNPHQYYNGYETEQFADADKTLTAFISECLKVPDHCGFSHRNLSTPEISEAIYTLLDDLKAEPLIDNQTVISSGAVRTFMRFALYGPPNYSNLSYALDDLLSTPPKTTLFKTLYESQAAGTEAQILQNEAPLAIPCSEKKAPQQTFAELEPVFDEFASASRLLGSFGITLASTCANWRVEAKERYEGDFNVTTLHPLLIIGGSYDTGTPLVSARNLTDTFPGGLLVEHDGFGHTSTAQGSSCTAQIIRDYVSLWQPPSPHTVCETDYGPFENTTYTEWISASGFGDVLLAAE